MIRPAAFVIFAACWIASPLFAGDSSSPWQAAAGKAVITPQQPVWMAGYAARDKPSEGKVHDLFAKVLVMEDDVGTRLVIVTTDLIGITPELRAGVESMVQEYDVSSESLLMNASHTHCGPELRGDRLMRFGIDAKFAAISRQYVRETAARIAELIGETLQRLEPSRLIFSRARAGFAMNRRLPTPTGFVNSPNPDGPVDHDVPVLRVEDANGNIKTILFGYACHATTLNFQQLCGDYPGFAQQYIEEAHSGAIAMFINGCSGDQNPYPRRALELATDNQIVWVAGYSNDGFGYLPSLRVLKEGGYEGGGAMRYTTFPGPFDETVEDRVITKTHDLVARVRAGASGLVTD